MEDFSKLKAGQDLSVWIFKEDSYPQNTGVGICFKFTEQDEHYIYGESINYELKNNSLWNGNPTNVHRIDKRFIQKIYICETVLTPSLIKRE